MKLAGFGNSILPFVPANKRQVHLFVVFFAICLEICAISVLFLDMSFSKFLIVAGLLPILILLVSSAENFFIFIVIYSFCFHLDSYAHIFRGVISVRLSWRNLYPLYAIFLVYWIFSMILRKRKARIGTLGWSIIIYVSIAVLSFTYGLFNGYCTSMRSLLTSEIFPQLMYLSFFVFITTRLKQINRKIIFDFFLFASTFIGLQLIYAFSKNNIAAFTRINTITVQVSLLAFPYVLGILYFTKGIKRKIIFLIALLPISLGVLISLQRSLWLAIIVVFIVSLFIYFYKKGFSFTKIVGVLIAGIIGSLVILTIAIWGLSKITSGAAVLVLLKRFISLSNIQYLQVDASGFVRMTEINQALAKIHGIQWLFGRGIGDTFYSFLRTTTKPYLDNSYAWVLWKMGIIGLISFLSMFVILFHRAIFVLRKCTDKNDLIYTMTISLNMLGIMICSLGNASLVQFRYIIVWSVSMAMMEIIYRKYRYETSVSLLK